jgi:protease-4
MIDEYVAVINLKDPIYKYSQECGPTGTKSKMQSMKSYAQDPNCIGVVLDIDSGGGQVSGTPEFYDYIASFKNQLLLILMD